MRPINQYIDHAALQPHLTRTEARRAIQLGVDFATRAVCVRPCDIEMAQEICKDSVVDVSTVLAFPHGCALTRNKVDEAKRYAELGVSEVDMVANYGFILSADWDAFELDVTSVLHVLRPEGILLKVILETAALDLDSISIATRRCAEIGVDFVKTSTGFGPGGATEDAVRAMLDAAAGEIGVKASGGIRSADSAKRFIDMGCRRLGVGYTSTATICEGGESDKKDVY